MKKELFILAIIWSLLFAMGCDPTYTDTRDGQVYKTVKIGSQWWMAENMNYEMDNSWCFEDEQGNCDTYGRLYAFETALTACPSGWRLPDNKDWNILIDYLGAIETAGGRMKATGTLQDSSGYWLKPNTGATNESGFSGLPGGSRSGFGHFNRLGSDGYWWSATDNQGGSAILWRLSNRSSSISEDSYLKQYGLSVRCIRN